MDQFHIIGPNRLSGSVRSSGAKNAALPALAASLLTEDRLRLTRVPAVRDIHTMLRLLEHLGVAHRWNGDGLELQPASGGGAPPDDAPYSLVKTMRASVLVLGPLVARLGHARVSLPGGCAIGARPIDQHLAGLEALGAEVTLDHGYVEARAERLAGATYRFSTPTVTGTENLLMAAALASGTTRLDNCAREPEVVDLARLLTEMGAHIEGAGEESIEIEGVESLGSADHEIISDRIETGTYLIAGAITGGEVEVEGGRAADLEPLLEKLDEIGCEVEARAGFIRVSAGDELVARSIVTAPYPGYPTDLQAQYMALMTRARGLSTICETVFENRFQHVPELRRMGAEISVEGRIARVHGPSALSGAKVMATDLRASACLVLAALAADGETFVDRIYHLDRGYQEMELKLQSLGARVRRVSGDRG